jgi:hypothetical protein
MKRVISVRAYLGVLPLLAAAVAAGPAIETAADQVQAGYLATWADLSTWTRASRDTGQTEVGLGLVLDGPSGAMRLAFVVNQPARGRARTPTAIGFRVASGARVNPALLRTPTLIFTARVPAGTDRLKTVELDLSSAMTVDNPAPGAAITSALGSMPARDFQMLADARDLSAVLLGARVVFRNDQQVAVRAFRDRVFPPKQ